MCDDHIRCSVAPLNWLGGKLERRKGTRRSTRWEGASKDFAESTKEGLRTTSSDFTKHRVSLAGSQLTVKLRL